MEIGKNVLKRRVEALSFPADDESHVLRLFLASVERRQRLGKSKSACLQSGDNANRVFRWALLDVLAMGGDESVGQHENCAFTLPCQQRRHTLISSLATAPSASEQTERSFVAS